MQCCESRREIQRRRGEGVEDEVVAREGEGKEGSFGVNTEGESGGIDCSTTEGESSEGFLLK